MGCSLAPYEKGAVKTKNNYISEEAGIRPLEDLPYKIAMDQAQKSAQANLLFGGQGYGNAFGKGTTAAPVGAQPGSRNSMGSSGGGTPPGGGAGPGYGGPPTFQPPTGVAPDLPPGTPAPAPVGRPIIPPGGPGATSAGPAQTGGNPWDAGGLATMSSSVQDPTGGPLPVGRPKATPQGGDLAQMYKRAYYEKYKNDPQMLGTYTPIDMANVAALDQDPAKAVEKYMQFTETARQQGYNPYDLMRSSHWTGTNLAATSKGGTDWNAALDQIMTSNGTRGSGSYGPNGFGAQGLAQQMKSATPEQLAQMEESRRRQWGDVGYQGGGIAQLAAQYGNVGGAAPPPAAPGFKMPTAAELAYANKYKQRMPTSTSGATVTDTRSRNES